MEGIAECDGHGRVVTASPAFCRVFGIGSDEAIGRDLASVTGSAAAGRVSELLGAALAGVTGTAVVDLEGGGSAEVAFHPQEGAEGHLAEAAGHGGFLSVEVELPPSRWMDCRYLPVDRERSRLLAVFQDVTDRHTVVEAMTVLNRRLQLMNRVTRHDVLNHLAVVVDNMDRVRTSIMFPAQVEYLDRIERSAEAIREQLAFTRSYEAIGTRAVRWLELEEAVRAARPGNSRLGGWEVCADPHFSKAFYGLVSFAVGMGADTDAFELVWEPSEARGRLAFSWPGAGLVETERAGLFDPRPPPGSSASGFGLGLPREILGLTGIGLEEQGTPGREIRFEMQVPPGRCRPKGT